MVNEILNRAENGSQEGVSKVFFNEIDLFFQKVGSILGIFEKGIDWGHKFLRIRRDVSVPVGLLEGKGKVHSATASFKATASMEAEAYVVPKEINELIAEREKARKEKDWALSDKLRDKIADLGFTVRDTPQGAMAVPKK